MGEYSWEAYYREAFEKCRRENLALAERTAEAERRREELACQYGRIAGNPLYRLTAPLRLAGRAVGKGVRLASCRKGARPEAEPCREEAVLKAYGSALRAQKRPYELWIDGVEAEQRKRWPSGGCPADFLILLCEEGETEAGAVAWACDTMRAEGSRLGYMHEDFCAAAGKEELRPVRTRGRLVRFSPWMKPAWQPDTFLSFFCMGSLVLAEKSLVKAAAAGMEQVPEAVAACLTESGKAAEKPPLGQTCAQERAKREENAGPGETGLPVCRVEKKWLYDLCLRAQEILDAQGAEPRLLDAVGFHRYFRVALTEEERQGRFEQEAELRDQAEAQLQRELAEGKHVWGYTAEYLPVREEAARRRGLRGRFAAGKDPSVLSFVPEAVREDGSRPPVSVIIPSKDHPEVLERCVRSIREKTAYTDYEIIVVDNGSGPGARPQLERLVNDYSLRYYRKEMPFNFSRMCREGAALAKGELLLFLNDDIEVIEENWLGILAGQACQPHTGAVGAKLYYPGGERLQHAGVTNMGIGPSHKLATFSDGRWYYFGQNRFTQDCLAVTGACLCVRKSLWEELGGFEEVMPVAYNDVDFCFRLYEAGYTNVLRNDAVLFHHESLSRGLDERTEEKWNRLLLEKERLYARQQAAVPGRMRVDAAGKDPYYSPHLAQDVPEYGIAPAGEERVYLRTAAPKPLGVPPERLKKYGCPQLHVTADRVQRQLKIHRTEPEIYLLDGWSYVQGADNCRYERWLILLPAPDSAAESVPAADRPGGTEAAAGKADGRQALRVPLKGKYRPDVEAILPAERHIGLAGFEVRLLRKDLQPGNYRIGLLCRDRETGDFLYRETDRLLQVKE